MLQDIIKNSDLNTNLFYIDTTFGQGGHTKEFLKYTNDDSTLILIDKNIQAYNIAKKIIKNTNNIALNISFELFSILSVFYNIKIYACIIIDLGMSTNQLLNKKKGLTYKKNGFLDMRFNKKQKIRALDWLHNIPNKTLFIIINILSNYMLPNTLKKIILTLKKTTNLITSYDLKNKIKNKYINKLFNIIRTFTNNELTTLIIFNKNINFFFNKNSKLIFISFNSLEDRIIKNYIKKYYYINYIVTTNQKKIIKEIEKNISARSSITRIINFIF